MEYQALYRKYRSQTFEEIAGQQHIVKTLKNALINDRIAHAYLFTGPRGTGKTSMARLFAKALNCDEGMGHICNYCENCELISKGSHPDVIEIDAASNSRVEEIRNIIERVKYAPIKANYKIYIIDEVHMLSNSAFNALLKTLEEPPENVIFILATTEPHKVLPTIVSRCQRFDFTRLNDVDLEEQIKYVCDKEDIEIEETAIKQILTLADGGVRDALSILDQLYSYCENKITYEDVIKVFGLVSKDELIDFVASVCEKNTNIVLNKLYTYNEDGVNIKKMNDDIIVILKDTLIYKTTSNYSILHILDEKEASYLSDRVTINQLNMLIDTFIKCSNEFKFAANIRSFYEIVVLKASASTVEEQAIEVKPVVTRPTRPTVDILAKQEPKKVEMPSVDTSKVEKIEEPKVENKPVEPVKNTQNHCSSSTFGKTETKKEVYVEPKDVETLDEAKLQKFSDEVILRAIVKSSKETKQLLFSKWNKLNDLLDNPLYSPFVTQLKNSTIYACCDELLILQTQFKSILQAVNNIENTKIISDMIKAISGKKLKVYAIDYSEGRRIVLRYNNLFQVNKLPVVKEGESIFDE